MDRILYELLTALLEIGKSHPELYDSDVRERMGEAIMRGFVRAEAGYAVPDGFGLYSTGGDAKVKNAITTYISRANKMSAEVRLTRFHDRLASFQDSSVQTSVPGNDYEEFFGHTPPEFYDKVGNVVRTR